MIIKLHVHGSNIDGLFEHIPKTYLPEAYGGDAGSFENITEEWVNKVLSYRQYIEDSNKYGVDENKRMGKKYTQESLFGIDGSFRKLNVD